MKQVIFDFDTIQTADDFYAAAKIRLQLPEYFGNNLDALWDCVTGDIELPVEILFINMTTSQLEIFEGIIAVFEDASIELDDDLSFKIDLKDNSEMEAMAE
jgi:ribonuclease inhibitor